MKDSIYKTTSTPQFIAYTLLMCFIICKNSLITYIFAVFRRIPIIGAFTTYLPPLIILVLAYYARHEKNESIVKTKDLLVPAFVIIALLLTVLIYPQNVEYITYNYSYYIAFCIPAFFIGLSCNEFDDNMFRIIANVSCISIVASYVFTFMYVSKNSTVVDELGQSYSVLLCTLMIGGYYFSKKKKIYLIMYLLGVIYALSLGSRGPIICVCVHSVLCLFFSSKLRLPNKIAISFAIFLVVMIVLKTSIYNDFLITVQRLLKQNNMSTRVIDFLLSGEYISHTSGRDEIYDQLFILLRERPLVGYGLFGEWPFIHWNAHELYLEVLFEYGYILGSILIIWYLFTVLSAYIKEKDISSKLFITALVSFVLVQGVMSYSHLRPELFLLLGFCIRCNRKRIIDKKQRSESLERQL